MVSTKLQFECYHWGQCHRLVSLKRWISFYVKLEREGKKIWNLCLRYSWCNGDMYFYSNLPFSKGNDISFHKTCNKGRRANAEKFTWTTISKKAKLRQIFLKAGFFLKVLDFTMMLPEFLTFNFILIPNWSYKGCL